MFKITKDNINTPPELSFSKELTLGGTVHFQGTVRNHNDGREVVSLEYECYEEMSFKEGLRICEEALKKFDIQHAYCVHRIGKLALGDTAVWVVAASAHRKEAFEACQYIIDHVKSRAPIWKKESYKNGDWKWVACHKCGEHARAPGEETRG